MAASTTTSSSSAPAPAEGRSHTPSRRRARASCCSNAATSSPREDNWSPDAGLRRWPLHLARHLVRRDGNAFQPQVHYFVGGRRSSTAPRCTGCARRTSASSSTSTASRPRGRSGTTTSSPTTRRPSGSTRSTASTARTRPRATGAGSTRGRRSRTSRGSSRCSTICRRRGYHPFPAPCGILLDEADRAASTCIRCTWCDGYPCLVHAKSDAETIAVRPLLDLPNVTLLVNAEVTRLETDDAGTTVTGVVVSRAGRRRRRRSATRRTSSSSPPVPRTAPSSCCASANDRHPDGLANGSDQVGRNYMFHNSKAVVALAQGAQRDDVPEDARAQRLLLRRRRLRLAGREHPDGRQVERGGDEGRGAEAHAARAALALADTAEHAVDFWLTTEDLPTAREPRHARRRRQRAPGLPRRATTRRPTASTTS